MITKCRIFKRNGKWFLRDMRNRAWYFESFNDAVSALKLHCYKWTLFDWYV